MNSPQFALIRNSFYIEHIYVYARMMSRSTQTCYVGLGEEPEPLVFRGGVVLGRSSGPWGCSG